VNGIKELMISGSWFERQKNIVDYSMQSLLRRRSKNILILIIFILLVFAVSSILFITGSLTQEMMITSNDLPDITVQRILGGRQVNVLNPGSGGIFIWLRCKPILRFTGWI